MSHARRAGRAYPDLATWRRNNNLNQRAAARKLGISQTTYSRLERGVRVAVREDAKHIMAVTGVPLEVLVGVN